MWRRLAVVARLVWMVEGLNETSCLLQFRPGQGVLSAGKRFKGCSSSSHWQEQLSLTPLPAAPFGGTRRAFADAAGEFGLLAWTQTAQTGILDQVLVYQNVGSRYYEGSSGWELSANLTEIAAQNVSLTEGWAKTEVAISSANLVVAAQAGRSLEWHTFRFDGASWNFLGVEDVRSQTALRLGGNRVVLSRSLNGKNRFRTFELPASGTGWSELTFLHTLSSHRARVPNMPWMIRPAWLHADISAKGRNWCRRLRSTNGMAPAPSGWDQWPALQIRTTPRSATSSVHWTSMATTSLWPGGS